MASRRVLIPCALLLGGCFPEFVDWREGQSSTSATGGAASSSSDASTSSAGTGGAAPTCEDLGGQCLTAPDGFNGPARLSNTGCGTGVKLLGVGNALANPQTGTCHFLAKPDECDDANVLVSIKPACEMGFLVHDYKETPDMNVCATTPGNYVSFKVNVPSRGACKQTGVVPFLAFDGQLDLCLGTETCENGERCAPPGQKFCVWNQAAPAAPCPADYPERLEQKTADASCTSSEMVDCEPKLLFGADCMLDAPMATEILDDQCKDWPAGAENWALEPGSAGPCADGVVKAVNSRSITICCTVAP